jgi:hypothetical protein
MGRYSRRKAMHPNPLLSPSSSSPPSKKKVAATTTALVIIIIIHYPAVVALKAPHKNNSIRIAGNFCVQELRSASSCYVRLFGK